MTMRPSTAVLSLLSLMLALFIAMLLHASFIASPQKQGRKLVKQLGLSDLSLFTEARYTRHASMADLHTPFQDHPISMDHFPTGSLIGPPDHLRKYGGLWKSDEGYRQ